MADKVILLDFWASMFGMRARIALAEKGIDYEYREENLAKKGPLLLQMNPVHKKIPVLIHNGKPISESLVIVQYIDETWSDKASLLPKHPYERAKMFESGFGICKNKGEAREAAKKELIQVLKALEAELGEKPFFGGESFGYVDVALVPFASWFYTYETDGKFSIEEHCPVLSAWVKRCMERESVSNTLPDPLKIYEFAGILKKRYGLE